MGSEMCIRDRAVGVSKISENGNWVVKASTSVNTRSKPTAGAGVGFQW